MIYDKYKRDHLLIMSLTAINFILLLIIIYKSFTFDQQSGMAARWLTISISAIPKYNLFISAYILCVCLGVLYLREKIRSIKWLYIVCLVSILLCTILIGFVHFFDKEFAGVVIDSFNF